MKNQNYGARNTRNAVTRDLLNEVLKHEREQNRLYLTAAKFLGSNDSGMATVMDPFDFEVIVERLRRLPGHMGEINKSIAEFANNPSPKNKFVSEQSFLLDDRVERHLYN